MENIISFLNAENPDIAALQEVYHNPKSKNAMLKSYSTIKKELNYPYHVFAPALTHELKSGETGLLGNAIFSRFPITSHHVVFFDVPFGHYREGIDKPTTAPRNMLCATLSLPNGKEVSVFNLHGIWGTDGNDTDRRLKMVDDVIKQIKGRLNVILSGDFNLNEIVYPRDKSGQQLLNQGCTSQAVTRLEKQLVNVFKGERVTSFNKKYKDFVTTEYGTAVVDMVFVSPTIKVIKHHCPEVDVSDHLPIVCTFEVE